MKEGRFPRESKLEPLFELVDAFAAEDHVHPDRVSQLKLSLEELFANRVQHPQEARGDVLVRLESKGSVACLTIQDFGVDDWEVGRAPKPGLSSLLESRKRGGPGLDFVSQMAEQIRHLHEERTATIKIVVGKDA